MCAEGWGHWACRGLRRPGGFTLGAEGNDSRDFVTALRSLGDTPQVVQSDRHRASAIDQRTTRHAGYRLSVHKRWLVEKPIGWLKLVCGLRKIKLRGLDKAGWLFQFGCAAYNLIRIPTSCWSAVPQVEIPAPSRA